MPKARKTPSDKKHGVTVTAWEGHPVYRWRVSFPDGDKRKTKGFKKKTGAGGALEFANEKRGLLTENGARHGDITDGERRAVIDFREMVHSLPESVEKPTLADAVDLLRATLKVRHKSRTVVEVTDSYRESLERKGVSESHLYSVTKRLERFAADHGDWLACDISSEVVGDWLEELRLAPQTVNHYRAALIQLFNHALDKGNVESNPVANVAKRRVKSGEVGILRPRQVAVLLEQAAEEILPALALGFFAGIRRAELARLDWSEINFEEDLVEIRASKSKTAARRLIPLRENLKAWLLPHRRHAGTLMPSEQVWRSRLRDAMSAAGILEWPHNAPRHSFASYHLAHFHDAAALALEMGHDSTKMIFEHYRALVTPKAAASYWQITPEEDDKIRRLESA